MSSEIRHALDSRTFLIGILGVTACVLFVGLMLLTQAPAYALGMNDRGGDYIMSTQQISTSQEAIVIVDAAAKQMIVYEFDYSNRRLNVLHKPVALDQMPKPQRSAPPGAHR